MSDVTSIVPLSAHLKKLYGESCKEVLQNYGLSQSELEILDVLSSDCGFDTAAQISRIRCIKKANVSTAVERLTLRGFIGRSCDEKDKRVIHLKLTDAATDAVKAIKAAHNEFLKRVMSILPEGELKTLTELIEKLTLCDPEPCGAL